MPFPVWAFGQLAMSDTADNLGRLLMVASQHVDQFLAAGARLGDLDESVKVINTAYERTFDRMPDARSYVQVEAATRESGLEIEIPPHGACFLSDVTCELRTGAMEAGFALGVALAMKIGGAR